MNDKARIKMEAAIWNHGRKKATLTEVITKLKRTDLANHPDVKKAIDILTAERKRLDSIDLF